MFRMLLYNKLFAHGKNHHRVAWQLTQMGRSQMVKALGVSIRNSGREVQAMAASIAPHSEINLVELYAMEQGLLLMGKHNIDNLEIMTDSFNAVTYINRGGILWEGRCILRQVKKLQGMLQQCEVKYIIREEK